MIKQIVPEDVCLECQGCCRFLEAESSWLPSLLNEEISALIQNPACKVIISDKKKIKPVFSQKNNNYLCYFLNPQENKCGIYPLRPLECQLYPFLINAYQEKVWLALDFNCPFAETHYETQEFIKYVEYLTGLLESVNFKKIFKDNPQIIQAYPNARNLREIII